MLAGEAQLNEEYFARTKLNLNYKREDLGTNMHYGVDGELALPRSTFTLNTGIRREEEKRHLRVSGDGGKPTIERKCHTVRSGLREL